MATLQQLIEKAGQVAVLKAHPVGSYFITEEDRNPAEILELGGVYNLGEDRRESNSRLFSFSYGGAEGR